MPPGDDAAGEAREHRLDGLPAAPRSAEHAAAVRLHHRHGPGEAGAPRASARARRRQSLDHRRAGRRRRSSSTAARARATPARCDGAATGTPGKRSRRKASSSRSCAGSAEAKSRQTASAVSPSSLDEPLRDQCRDALELFASSSGVTTLPSWPIRSRTPMQSATAREWLRLGAAQVVRVFLVDPADRDDVLEARGGDDDDVRAAALEQRVRSDGRAERQRRSRRRLDAGRFERVEHRGRGRGGRRGRLADDERPGLVVEDDQIGEGASGVDAGAEGHAYSTPWRS